MHISTPDLSVIVPTLNSAATLPWTLLSLRAQIGVSVEVLAVDSYSTDATEAICRDYGVRVLSRPAGNMYRAINAGIRESRGRWLTYLNSDDYVYPDSFSRLISAGERDAANVVYGMCDYVDEYGRHIHSFIPAPSGWLGRLFRANICPLPQQGTIFRREVLSRAGLFSEHLRLSSDYVFFREAHRSGARFLRLRAPSVAAFRIHGRQLSNEMAELAAQERDSRKDVVPPLTGVIDRLAVAAWKAGNAPAYLERLVRSYHLTGRVRPLRSITPPHRAAIPEPQCLPAHY